MFLVNEGQNFTNSFTRIRLGENISYVIKDGELFINSSAAAGDAYFVIRVLDKIVSHVVDTNLTGDIVMPFNGVIDNIYIDVDTAGVTGNAQFDINKNGVSIFTSNPYITTGNKSTRTSFAGAIGSRAFLKGDILSLDIDTIQGTPAKGLTLTIDVTKTS